VNGYEQRYKEAKVEGADFDEFINKEFHPAEASSWFSSWDDLVVAAGHTYRIEPPEYYATGIL